MKKGRGGEHKERWISGDFNTIFCISPQVIECLEQVSSTELAVLI